MRNHLIYFIEVIFLIFKKIESYINSLYHEIKRINVRGALCFGGGFLIVGVISWILCIKNAYLASFYVFPRCALPFFYAHVAWAISFFFVGVIFGGILLGCEKFKRRYSVKIAFFLALTYLFSLCAHPIFFGKLSPFLAFIVLLASFLFCLLTIIASMKVFKLWTICLFVELFWLIYNLYTALAFSFVN